MKYTAFCERCKGPQGQIHPGEEHRMENNNSYFDGGL